MIKLAFQPTLGRCDLVRHDGNLETDEGLETAVLISLFTDARVDEPELRGGSEIDPRGWWGDAYARAPGDGLGSKLWALARKGVSAETRRLAEDFSREALAWLLADGLAKSITAVALPWRRDGIALRIAIERPRRLAPRWERTWEVTLGF